LWKANLKINTDERGFTFGFHVINASETAARTAADDIAKRYLALMPKSAEIFFATISKWDSKRDSRFLPNSIGQGQFVEDEGPPEVSDYDISRTSVLIRLEHDGGGSVTRKFCPVPDSIIFGGKPVDAIVPVTTLMPPAAAPGAGADWHSEFTNFMQALIYSTTHIESGGSPGGPYTSRVYTAAYAIRTGVKKGGRVFI
jgi:hypothetical protein